MSKWKCGICGSEFENYHAQGFDDTIYCPLCYFKEIYKREQKKTKLLQNQLQQKENIIKEVREYITSYESIETIQGLEDIEKNKDLDEKTLNEMLRRYMMVHDKLLEILDKKEVN